MEQDGSPILCSSCRTILGKTLMQKEDGVQMNCNVCYAPYTCYTWKTHLNSSYKRTMICRGCSSQRNACQVCLIGNALPLRDVINSSNFTSTSNVNMGKKRKSCKYNLNGACKKGVECLFRHDEFSKNHTAAKHVKSGDDTSSLTPPDDVSITTLHIGHLDPNIITEQDLHVQFSPHGDIRHINMVPARKCAFVIYKTRQEAEKAAEYQTNSVVIKNQKLKLSWANAQKLLKMMKPEEKHKDEGKEATQNILLNEEQKAVEVEAQDQARESDTKDLLGNENEVKEVIQEICQASGSSTKDDHDEVEEVIQKIRQARKIAMEEAREQIKLQAGKMAYEYISQRDKNYKAQTDLLWSYSEKTFT